MSRGRGKSNKTRLGKTRVVSTKDMPIRTIPTFDHLPEVASEIKLSDLSSDGKLRLIESLLLNGNDAEVNKIIAAMIDSKSSLFDTRVLTFLDRARKSPDYLENIRLALHLNRILALPEIEEYEAVTTPNILPDIGIGQKQSYEDLTPQDNLMRVLNNKNYQQVSHLVGLWKKHWDSDEIKANDAKEFIAKTNKYGYQRLLIENAPDGDYNSPERFLQLIKAERQRGEHNPKHPTDYNISVNADHLANIVTWLSDEGFSPSISIRRFNPQYHYQTEKAIFELTCDVAWVNEDGVPERIAINCVTKSDKNVKTIKTQLNAALKPMSEKTTSVLKPFLTTRHLQDLTAGKKIPEFFQTEYKAKSYPGESVREFLYLGADEKIPTQPQRPVCSHNKVPLYLTNGFISWACNKCHEPVLSMQPIRAVSDEVLLKALKGTDKSEVSKEDIKDMKYLRLAFSRIESLLNGQEIPQWADTIELNENDKALAGVDDIVGQLVPKARARNPLYRDR